VGEADSENKRNIAVIRQTIWDTLIHDLKENNLSPSLIIPDYLALPIDEESWTIFCGQPQSLVRLGKQQGYACDTNLLETLISLNLNEAAQAPNSVKIIHEPNSMAPQLELSSSQNTITRSLNDLLKPNALLADPPFNMLTRQFRKKRQKNQRSYWYWCGLSFATLIAVLFLGQLALYVNFKIKSSRLDNQLLSAYQKVFPGATQLTEPKFRVEQQLKEYELAPNPFISILERIGRVKSQIIDIAINTLSYSNSKVTLVVVANNNSDLNQFNKQLTNAGLKITSNQTNTAQKQITETLSVELL
jgi:type II secretion system protein L